MKNYTQLVELHKGYAESRGLRILAFPCNQFAKQVCRGREGGGEGREGGRGEERRGEERRGEERRGGRGGEGRGGEGRGGTVEGKRGPGNIKEWMELREKLRGMMEREKREGFSPDVDLCSFPGAWDI